MLAHSTPVFSAPAIFKGAATLLDFMLADQFCSFQLQDQTTGTKLYPSLLEKSQML